MADGVPITDSVAIMTFLGDRHGALTHAPGTLDRARQDSLTHAIIDEFDATLWMAARHSFILPEDKRIPEIKDSLRWEFRARTGSVRPPHGRGMAPYLMGEDLTIPDILLAHCMGWAINAKIPGDRTFPRAHHADAGTTILRARLKSLNHGPKSRS